MLYMRTLMLVAMVLATMVFALGTLQPVFGDNRLGQDCVAIKSGICFDPSVWSCVGVPTGDDNVTFSPQFTVAITPTATAKNLLILPNGSLTVPSNATLSVYGNFVN